MATATLFGPADHGRAVTDEEAAAASYREGYRYEIIDGRLAVSPVPDSPHDDLRDWFRDVLLDYRRRFPGVINKVSTSARVFVPGRQRQTAPEPDLAVYSDWPYELPAHDRNWRDHTPILVAEVVSADDPDKDLVRNVDLYRQVPRLAEYWVIDNRSRDPNDFLVRVYRRLRGRRWRRPAEFRIGGVLTTPTLPGFEVALRDEW